MTWSVAFFECPKTGIVGLNSARNVDVCWLFFFEVSVLALAQRPPEMSWWMSACPGCHMLVVNWNRSESLLSERWRRRKLPNVAGNELKHSADWNWSHVKGKVRPVTCHEGTKGEKYSSTLSLTSSLDRGGWSAPRPGRFTQGEETRYALYRRRLGGPYGQSGQVRNILLHRESILGPSSPYGIALPHELSIPEMIWVSVV